MASLALSVMFLRALGDRFKQVRWDVTYSATTLSLSDVIGHCYTAERNFVKSETQPVKAAAPKKGKPNTSSKPDDKSNKQDTVRKDQKGKGLKYCDNHGVGLHSTEECRNGKPPPQSVTTTSTTSTTAPQNNVAGSSNHVSEMDANLANMTFNASDFKSILQSRNGTGFIHMAQTIDLPSTEEEEEQAQSGPDSSTVFLVDSGASHHMTNSLDNFINFTYESGSIHLAKKGQIFQMDAEGHGDIVLDMDLGNGESVPVVFDNVMYVPSLANNLMSTVALEDQGFEALVTPYRGDQPGIFKSSIRVAHVVKVGRHVVIHTTGMQSNVLPQLREHSAHATSSTKPSARLWHRRMGHLGIDNLQKLLNVGDGIEFKDDFGSKCEDCILANQPRSPRNGTAAGTASKPGELVHTDLCSPFRVRSAQGNEYWMPIVDDYSRTVTIYFMKNKDDAPQAFDNYMAQESASRHPVKSVRFDNGGEFRSTEFVDYLKSKGLLLEPSPSYRPESNGLAERTNGTIQSKIRAIFQESKLPLFLWQSLSETACYLHNRSPSKPLGGMTPYEKKTGNKPDLTHVRVPGCKVYVHIPKEKRQTARMPKITPRGKLCRLLGFTTSKSIYIVYDPSSKRIERTRDVIFDEGPDIAGDGIDELDVLNEDFDEDEDDVTNAPPAPYSSVFREEQKAKPQPNISIDIPRRSTRSYIDGTRLDDDELDDMIYSTALHASAGTGNKTITYEQARKSPKWPLWLVALKVEYDALIANKVWVEVKIDGIKNILPGHWVLVEKPDRLKARYVVQGNHQRPGIDYGETYAGTARSGSVKVLCSIMAVEGLSTSQLDALNAFLNSHLNGVDVYIRFPRGFEKPGYCCKLLKTLYGTLPITT